METRSGSTTDGIPGYDSFPEELFKDIADGLHAFFSNSSCLVSCMNCPINRIFSSGESVRCFSRQRGIPRP